MDKKKIAAAMAAVTAYIKTGEEVANQIPVSAEGEPLDSFKAEAPGMNLWGVSGRQALMQGGTMMQLRLFK